jgi:hypothetical protein
VPGIARRPSALFGSGPCSSWNSIWVHFDQRPLSRVRLSTVIWSSASCVPRAQVTPTAPKPETAWGLLTTRADSASSPPARAASPARGLPVGVVSAILRTRGSTGARSTSAGALALRAYAESSSARVCTASEVRDPESAPTTSRLTTDAAGVRAGQDHREGQQLLARGDHTTLKRAHDKRLRGEETSQDAQVSHQSHWSPQGFASNYKPVISSRHAGSFWKCQIRCRWRARRHARIRRPSRPRRRRT